jgi:hypothetical protein
MHLFLRLRRLWCGASAQDWGLLRLLLLWVRALPSGPGKPVVLRHAEQPMSDEGSCASGRVDWTRGMRGCLIWGVPVALLVISPERYFVVAWPTLVTFMGVVCLINAHRCGRIHCYFTGPFFLLLAGVGVLYGLGVLPLGARGWSKLSLALLIGSAVLLYVPERTFGRYQQRSCSTGNTPQGFEANSRARSWPK